MKNVFYLRRLYLHCFVSLYLTLAAPFSVADIKEVADALERPAIKTSSGQNAFILGLDRAGMVPVSVTLTAVSFFDKNQGFAVGHGGVVLATNDAGETWSVRLDGKKIADIMLNEAMSLDDEFLIASSKRLVEEGPDKPLLNLHLLSERELMVVGAYGIAMRSIDSGQTWSSLQSKIDNPMGVHIYSIDRVDNRLILAGEMGSVWLSLDKGQTYSRIETPYEGSFFTSGLTGNSNIVLGGLRGNVWVSSNNGVDWLQVPTTLDSAVTSLTKTQKGKLMLSNQAGLVLELNNKKLVPVSTQKFPPINDVLQISEKTFLLASARGLMNFNLGQDR